jgi:protein tyrosine phosphatase (PTP) superfamily phosphohydrolase (DUF442 family)
MDDTLTSRPNQRIEEIPDFLQISDQLATSGQPTIDQYPAIAAAGYQVVINLGLLNSPNALVAEASIASNLGLAYIHLPVEWNEPTLENFLEFAHELDQRIDQKIFVHCAANKRVSVFVYLYRLRAGTDQPTALQDLAKIWTPNPIWQSLIEQVLIAGDNHG